MPVSIELKAMVSAAYKTAKNIIEVDKAEPITPVFIALQPDKQMDIIATPLDDDDQKEALAQVLRQKFSEDGTLAYIHVSEAWMLDGTPGEGMPTIRPSKSERRKEIVVFCGQDAENHTAIFAMAEIQRDANNVRTLAPLDEKDLEEGSVGGRFGTLLFE